MTKTNAVRLLEKEKIPYKTAVYEYDENDLSGESAAAKMGIPCSKMYKTLVTRGDKTGINVFCIPVDCEINLKKAANATGNKNMEMIHVKELLPLTGYIRGGCSPIGMKKKYPTFIQKNVLLIDEVSISAGQRGLQIIIEPQRLIDFLNAEIVDIINEK